MEETRHDDSQRRASLMSGVTLLQSQIYWLDSAHDYSLPHWLEEQTCVSTGQLVGKWYPTSRWLASNQSRLHSELERGDVLQISLIQQPLYVRLFGVFLYVRVELQPITRIPEVWRNGASTHEELSGDVVQVVVQRRCRLYGYWIARAG
jgi:hypothetical protein